MKIFPTLAERTNLTDCELKTYFFVRCTYSVPFEKEKHDEILRELCMSLLWAGKVELEGVDFGEEVSME